MKIEIITLLIRLVIAVMAGVVLPKLRAWLISRTEDEKLNTLKEWAYIVVYSAEQMYHTAEKLDPDGTERRKYAYNAIMMMAEKLGVKLTGEEAIAMMEAAVYSLNQMKKKSA